MNIAQTLHADQAMTEYELAVWGDGLVAYIKHMTYDEVSRAFPHIEDMPKSVKIFFSLHGADGTPLALTDTLQAALGHAREDDLEIASIH